MEVFLVFFFRNRTLLRAGVFCVEGYKNEGDEEESVEEEGDKEEGDKKEGDEGEGAEEEGDKEEREERGGEGNPSSVETKWCWICEAVTAR